MNKQNTDAIIIMGVSGCGKSTVGLLLAKELNASFYDGDDFHPPENIAKMASGQPLNDQDRQGWLEALRDLINQETAKGQTTIIACSALKKSYRDLLKTANTTVHIIYLKGTKEILLERLTKRANTENHFMPSSLLDSQLSTLEDPTNEPNTYTLDITHTAEELAQKAKNLIPMAKL